MEENINIAEILKDKPQGTKLYDWLHNIDVELDTISTTDTETVVWCTNETDNNTTCHRGYSEFGTVRKCPNGLQILLPSKEMHDWSKFAWKKGDVLVSEGRGRLHVIFEGFNDDTYTTFKGKHYICNYDDNEDYNEEEYNDYNKEVNERTIEFKKDNDDGAQTYINTIEKRFGGKLNRETLEIEKTQPEFKDGDIAFADYGNRQDVFIVSDKTDLSEGYSSFISLDLSSLTLSMGYRTSFFKKDLCKLRLATEEKQQLFDALAKEGKAWDAKKKMIVDLKPKVELKPFDKVLCRNSKDDTWEADFFARLTRKEIDYTQSGKYLCVGDLWMYCIPYNEETAHLLGTTDDWKGGEQ